MIEHLTQYLLHSSGIMKLPGASAGEDQDFKCCLLIRNGKDKVSHHSPPLQTQFSKHRFEMIKNFRNWKTKKHYQLFSCESYGSMKMHLSLSWISCSLPCQHTCHLLAEPVSEPGCHRLQEGNGSDTVGKNWTRDPHTSRVSSMYHNTQITYAPVAEEVLRFVLLNSQQDKLYLGRSQNHVGLHTGCDPMKALTLFAAAPAPVKVSLSLIYFRGISTSVH